MICVLQGFTEVSGPLVVIVMVYIGSYSVVPIAGGRRENSLAILLSCSGPHCCCHWRGRSTSGLRSWSCGHHTIDTHGSSLNSLIICKVCLQNGLCPCSTWSCSHHNNIDTHGSNRNSPVICKVYHTDRHSSLLTHLCGLALMLTAAIQLSSILYSYQVTNEM